MQKSLPQRTWGWNIAAYLFLAGAGAGAYVAAFAAGVLEGSATVASWMGGVLSFPMVAGGMLFLIADLGVKNNALKAFARVKTSWMARGAWIISAFVVLDTIQLGALALRLPWPAAASLPAAILAVATMFYTGFLLKACRPISFWSTIILPTMFLASAASTGVMALVLGSLVYGGKPGSLAPLSRSDTFLILVESLVILVFLGRGLLLRGSRASVQMWITGRLAVAFWVGVVVCGLLTPLIAESYHLPPYLLSAAMLAGLTGGLLLRRLVLAAGIRESLLSPDLLSGSGYLTGAARASPDPQGETALRTSALRERT